MSLKSRGVFCKTRGRRGTLHLGPLDCGIMDEIKTWGGGRSRPAGAGEGRGGAMAKLAGVGQSGDTDQ